MQDINEKKSMLINLINKITIFDEKIEVKYKLKFDNFENNHYNKKSDCVIISNNSPTVEFSCQGFAQRGILAKI